MAICLLFPTNGCDRPPPAAAIEAIGINEQTCLPECHDIAIWLRRSGVASIGDTIGNTDWVSLPPGMFERLADGLVQTPFFSSSSDLREGRRTEKSANVSALVDGKFRLVFLSSPDTGPPESDAAARLRAYIADVRRETAPLKQRADADTRARLADVAHLREVTYDAKGCYGTCPIYTVHFFSDGRAVIWRRTPPQPATRAVSTIPFSHVIELLKAANFTYLERHYASKWQDTFGSEFRLDYDRHFSFWSQAPDSTQWSPVYRDVATRIDQLVLDTTWSTATTRT